jgi:hypothetical protein
LFCCFVVVVVADDDDDDDGDNDDDASLCGCLFVCLLAYFCYVIK